MAGETQPLPLGAKPPPLAIDPGTLARTQSPAPGPVGLKGGDAGASSGASASLGARVLAYAVARNGRRVGDGECFALADEALRAAGAKSAADFGAVTPDGDYVWGTAVSLSQVQPGDIVQFRDYESTRREERDDGSWAEESQSRPHHTAIVVSNDGNGVLTVIEQNAPPGSVVRRIALGFRNATARSGGSTVRITFTGQVWFYRPQAR